MIDTSKVIHAPVGGGRYTVTAPIVKEDYGLYLLIEGLELPSTYEVDFSNSEHNGTSVTMIGNADGVLIPSQFIKSGKDVFAFLYHVGADFGRTVYKFRIPNKLRPDRTNEQPTPEEQSTIDQAISALNSAVEQTAQDVISADQSAQSAEQSAQNAYTYALSANAASGTAENFADVASGYASQASASATASAQSASQSAQIKADVEELVDDAQASASASAQSASASANSASQASASATSASQSATSAQGYASQAQTSAQTASTKASEASAFAQTATQKATEASQSASQALGYKTDAESAKTTSQTAQGLAESARDTAVQAKTDAESARDEAKSLVDGISGKVEQIDQNTADIASLEEDRYKPYVVDSATGSIASFLDGADDIPLKSLVVDINPVQDLHGQEAPYPAGGGKNLFDADNPNIVEGYIGDSSFSTGNSRAKTVYIPISPNTTYTVSKMKGARFFIAVSPNIPANGIPYSERNANNVATSLTITSGADDAYLWAWVYLQDTDTVSLNDMLASVQIEKGSTATDYAPYENICPISGWTEVNVNHSDADMTNPTTITIDLGQTVYGAKLYPLEGKAVITMAMVDLGTLTWSYQPPLTGIPHGYFVTENIGYKPTGALICSCYKTVTTGWTTDKVIRNHGSIDKIYVIDSSYTSIQSFAEGVTGQQLVYELAEPIEIQLTPQQVNSLLGVNNLWADSGDTTAEYRADTKLFIERLTAPDSADMIADANIQSGKYFMVGNSLFKATANIANGSAIIVGTNCIRKSLSEALNEINV